jgi:hypothetical protein
MLLSFPGQEYDPTSSEVVLQEPQQAGLQRLIYRGQKYYTTPAEITHVPSDRTGMYRGIPFNVSSAYSAPSKEVALTYRGIPYTCTR